MSNIANKFIGRMFRRIGGLVWDITSGQIGIQTPQGIYSLATITDEAGAKTFTVNVNPFDDLGVSIPAFATQTAHADVNQGDIIVGDNGIIGWVVDKTDASFKVKDHNGFEKTYSPPKVQIVGQSGVLVVRNLFSLTGGADGAAGFANNLLPLLALGGGDEKLEKLLPLLLMSSQTGSAAGASGAGAAGGLGQLLPLLLLTKDGGLGGAGGSKMDKLLPLMLMGGMGGGAGAMNPLLLMSLLGDGDLLGGLGASTAKAPTLAPARAYNGVPALNRGS